MPSSQAFNMHMAARRSADCGVEDDVRLYHHQAVNLFRSLRGINAVLAVLSAETGEDFSDDAMELGDYLRGGLVEAAAMLTEGALVQFEHAQKNPVGPGLGGLEIS